MAGQPSLPHGAVAGPVYVVNRRFAAGEGARWDSFVSQTGLIQLGEVVSLDALLCPRVLDGPKTEGRPHGVQEDLMPQCFTDLAGLLKRVLDQQGTLAGCNILCVVRNPQIEPDLPEDFDLLGYDLMALAGDISTLTNSGGFPDVFAPKELNRVGLLNRLQRARDIQKALPAAYRQDPHALCQVWAIGRWNGA